VSGQFTSDQIALFLLVLARVGGLVVSAPLLGDPQVPRLVKAVVAIALTIVLVQVPSVARLRMPAALAPFALSILSQLLVGLALGLVARALFFAAQTAGQIVSMQTGLSLAAVVNPLTSEPDTILAQVYLTVAALVFLAANGDAWMLAALARSFDLSLPGSAAPSGHLVEQAVAALLVVTQSGLQLAAPVVASLFATTAVLGLIGRSLPQLNIFVLNMPLGLLLGLVAMIGSLAASIALADHATQDLPGRLLHLLGGAAQPGGV